MCAAIYFLCGLCVYAYNEMDEGKVGASLGLLFIKTNIRRTPVEKKLIVNDIRKVSIRRFSFVSKPLLWEKKIEHFTHN